VGALRLLHPLAHQSTSTLPSTRRADIPRQPAVVVRVGDGDVRLGRFGEEIGSGGDVADVEREEGVEDDSPHVARRFEAIEGRQQRA
jgi:hypothetical protein